MGKIFGTDGARGVVGKELTVDLALNIGKAAAQVIAASCKHKPRVVIGKDTRISSDMLEAAVAAGLCSVGAEVTLLGVVATPAVAHFVNANEFDIGVMISASHNPYEFNGIKLFGANGYKLTDEQEDAIEATILANSQTVVYQTGGEIGNISKNEAAIHNYVDYLVGCYCTDYHGKVLVDCANGSASTTARELFEKLHIQADFLFDTPNGININDNCGSTHIESLADKVVAGGYDLGFAFDGDADRLLCIDELGNVLDGDFLLAILAKYMEDVNRLTNHALAVTTMTNMGFFKLMKSRNTCAEITKVGDRYVLECMKEKGISLGGEQSGHIIFLDRATTGDGQLSAVELLNALGHFKLPLSKLAGEMTKYPQTMINVTVDAAQKDLYAKNQQVSDCIQMWESQLGDAGRIVVRPSGTEPYIRVMVEGEKNEQIQQCASEIADAIRLYLK